MRRQLAAPGLGGCSRKGGWIPRCPNFHGLAILCFKTQFFGYTKITLNVEPVYIGVIGALGATDTVRVFECRRG